MFNNFQTSLQLKLFTLLISLICSVASAETVLITGANQGIGWEFTKQYAEKGWHVIATHRRQGIPDTLKELTDKYDNIQVESLDVTKMDTIQAVARKLDGKPIDVLINNAGVMGKRLHFGKEPLDFEAFDYVYDINVAGVMRVTDAFYPNVVASKQKTITVMTSETGFFSDLGKSKRPPPLMSWMPATKTAINFIYADLAPAVKADGVKLLLLDPGLVRDTNEIRRLEAQGKKPPVFPFEGNLPERVDIDVCITGLIKVTDEATLADSGKVISYKGERLHY